MSESSRCAESQMQITVNLLFFELETKHGNFGNCSEDSGENCQLSSSPYHDIWSTAYNSVDSCRPVFCV